jgi:CotS family spore coat protein
MISVKPAAPAPPPLPDFFLLGPVLEVARYRSVAVVRTREGSFIVKPLQIGSGKAALCAKLLRDHCDCPVLPDIVPSGDAGAYWRQRGNRYLITRQIHGREADYWQNADLGAAIRAMAQFHRCTAPIVAARQPGWSLLRFQPEQAWRRACAEMETCRRIAIRRGDSWSRQYLKLWDLFRNQASQAIREIATVAKPDFQVICYHDWAHHNVLVADGQVYLIDFDALVQDWPTHDRANLCGRYLRLQGFTNRALLRLLGNFDRFYPWRRGELALLRVYLTFPYDYWMIGRQYYLERQPWSLKYFRDQWQRKIAPYQVREKVLQLLEKA